MELQELVARGRLILGNAPKQMLIFKLVNGKNSAKEISIKTKTALSNTLKVLLKMNDMELIRKKQDQNLKLVKKDNSIVYEKHPLLKHLPISYFEHPEKIPRIKKPKVTKRGTTISTKISIPSEQQILTICSEGEDQLYEFKASGVDMDKLSKEACAFANTNTGGFIFYGVEDDGTIQGSDKTRQAFDQSIQNSIKNNIEPSLHIKLVEKDVMGYKILVLAIPPRNLKEVFHYKNVVYIRIGTNAFKAKADQVKKLYNGIKII